MAGSEYYNHTTYPSNGAQLSSSAMRAELDAIEAGFGKLPDLSGNGGKMVAVNAGGTALEAITTTGTGNGVRATSPTLVTPILGTPTSGTLTNCTGLPVSTGISGFGANVATALAVAVGSAGAVVVNGGALGTPASGTATNLTGLPIATGVSGLGTGVATALAVNTGSAGAFVLYNGALGTPASGTLTNATGLPVSTGISGLGSNMAAWLADPTSAKLANTVTDETGSGALVFATAPALSNPTITNYVETLYAPAANTAFTVDLANGTFQKLTTSGNVTITLPSSVSGKSYAVMVAYGGTHTVTWAGGSTIKWAGGAAPAATSTSGKFDIYVFSCDGTNTYGADGGRNY